MKTSLIVQARMTSKRLPGKVMMKVLGKPLLFYLLERLKKVKHSELIVATTTNKEDQPIVDFCRNMKVKVFRGSEEDVLSRYVQAAEEELSDIVVRITADCPLIDPTIIEKCIQKLIETGSDYVSNTHNRTYPKGMDVEVMKRSVLNLLDKAAKKTYEREHVTPYIMTHSDEFNIEQITMAPNLSDLRLTVDTIEDFNVIKRVIEALYPKNPDFSFKDIKGAI